MQKLRLGLKETIQPLSLGRPALVYYKETIGFIKSLTKLPFIYLLENLYLG